MDARVISGLWRTSSEGPEYKGELHIDEVDSVMELRIVFHEVEGYSSEELPFGKGLDYICGTTLDGKKITLCNCSLFNSSHKFMNSPKQFFECIIRVQFAFWGIWAFDSKDLRFDDVQVDYGDIVSWADLSHYEYLAESKSYALTWICNDPVGVSYGDNVEVTIFPSQEAPVYSDREDVSLKQRITARFQYKQSVFWQTVLDDVTCLAQLASFARREHVGIRRIWHSSYSKTNLRNQDEATETSFPESYDEVIFSLRGKQTENTNHPIHYLFKLNKLMRVGGLKAWFVNYSELKPIINLYLMAFSERIGTSEGFFLNLVQALEVFHVRFVAGTKEKYENHIRDMIKDVAPQSEWDYYENLFLGNGQEHRKNVFLKNRLIDLLYANGERPFIVNMDQCEAFACKVANTRNYYTHYDSKRLNAIFQAKDYPAINEMLMAVLEYHIMLLLGFNVEFAKNKAAGWIWSNHHLTSIIEGSVSDADADI